MLTKEDYLLTAKYINDYTKYCASRECGVGCPVFDEHQRLTDDKSCSGSSPSCFRIYCRFREEGKLPAPTEDPKENRHNTSN